MKARRHIPKVGLYGESVERLHPGFVHIENIADRSREYDWSIKPHRHGKLFQILYLKNGKAELVIDDESRSVEGYWAICLPPGTVHGFTFPVDTEGKVLTVMDDFIQTDNAQLRPFIDLLMDHSHLIRFSSSDVLLEQLEQIFKSIEEEVISTQTGHSLMLGWLVNMVFVTLFRQIASQPHEDVGGAPSRQTRLIRFRQLLESHYRQHWGVQEYAAALSTSASSLNRACREQMGVSAKTQIQERLLLEIKRRLIYTGEPLDQIAYKLGFKDPSYFSRFFKRSEGQAPGEYRKQQYHETETTL